MLVHQERVIHPGREARALLGLVRSGAETPESVRKLIGDAPDRHAVRIAFDLLAARLSVDRMRRMKRLRQRLHLQSVSEHLRNRISSLMRAGWSKKKIRAALPVSWPLLQEIAREAKPSLYKRGCGRRLSAEMREQLQSAIAAGRPPFRIRSEFGVSYTTIHSYRRAAGLRKKDN